MNVAEDCWVVWLVGEKREQEREFEEEKMGSSGSKPGLKKLPDCKRNQKVHSLVLLSGYFAITGIGGFTSCYSVSQ